MHRVQSEASSLNAMILPLMGENAARLEKLFTAIDTVESTLIPPVMESLQKMDDQIKILEAAQAKLEPSSFSRMFSM